MGESELYKHMRLSSLQESPFAFGASYESALNRSPQSWREQADGTAQGSDRATFIAFADDLPIGITALYRDQNRLEVGELLQVWVAPEYRGTGAAVNILDVVFRWAGENGFRTIIAGVTKVNTRALQFYRNNGFILTDAYASDHPDGFVLVKEIV